MLVRQRQVPREHSRMRQYDRPRLLSRETEREVQVAIDTWAECLSTGAWPGYPPYVAVAEAG